MAKVAKFVLSDQPPPRKDTPFWIIAESYEQVCKACWKEKLFGHGHIPECEIDRPRIRWYKPNQNWPFEVPLRPWPGYEGRNWSLQFKSYKQGRGQMQAESIGGFCFVEQFPWGLLEEVLRGCREYNFPGSKMCEFTPVDPRLSVELEDMIEKGSVPEGWEIYRANTECALEAGHVSAEWFREFFGMVPEEMRMTRMTGAFASFQGAIYKNFNPAVHLVGDETITFPPNIYHRRAIDWGAGPSNAFCCLWAYKDGMGRWFVYDEYYSTDTSLTTIEHLCEVQDRWPWPEGNPHYGTTYADPSDPGNLRIAAKLSAYVDNRENIWITPASNAVHEGIEHVQYLFKPSSVRGENGEVVRREPMLFIHKEACPILSKQLRTYRWMNPTESGINPRDARKEPLKKDDHACFPESVLVATPAGLVRLGDVRSGDEIITHRGVGRVDVGAKKIGTREVIRVTLQDGRSIVCTAEHPLAIGGADWIAAGDSLGKSVNVLENEAWSVLSQEPATEIECCASSMGDSSGGDIPTRNIMRSGATTADQSEGAERKANCRMSGFTSKSMKTASGSAHRSAGHTLENRGASTTSVGSAAFADANSSATATHRRKLARKNVSESVVVRIERNIGTEDVYNLSTSDGTFFANGILVSNCDALRYLVYSEDRMTGATPEAFGRDRDDAKHGVKSPGRSGRRWGHRTTTNGKG